MPPRGSIGARFGGVFVTRNLFGSGDTSGLLHEAHVNWNQATLQDTAIDDHADGRGGQPARRLWSGPGGPIQDALYHDPEVARKLAGLVGRPVRPAGSRGSYSYYTDRRQFLALHRDVVTCDLTTITVIYDTSSPADRQGGLLCYPDRCHEPMSAIRGNPARGARVVKAPVGTTIILAGGEVAHRLLPVAPGTTRIISALCFEVV